MPVPLDEYPVHQVPLSMRHMATSDRNAYDRCYFNAHDRTGDVFLVTGHGRVPQPRRHRRLRHGPARRRSSTRCGSRTPWATTAWPSGSGPYRIEVLEPLERVRVVCEGAEHGIAFDLTWTGSFPTVEEPAHVMRQGGPRHPRRPALRPGGHVVGDARGRGRRARRRRRPLGRAPATGRGASDPWESPSLPGAAASEPDDGFGFWWTYVPAALRRLRHRRHRPGGRRRHPHAQRGGAGLARRPRGARPSSWVGPRSRSATAPGPVTPRPPCSTCAPGRARPSTLEIETLGFVGAQLRSRLRRRPRLGPRPVAGPELDRGRGRRHARPGRDRTDPLRRGRPRGPGHAATAPRDGACSSTGPSAATSRRASPTGSRWPRCARRDPTAPTPTPAPRPTPRRRRARDLDADRDELHGRLVTWLATKVRDPEVSELVVPESNGMSSETLLFECILARRDGGAHRATVTQACAARLRPRPRRRRPSSPCTTSSASSGSCAWWRERIRGPRARAPCGSSSTPTPSASPFFVMERVDGLVPPDIMPYPFGSWLSEAPPADQRAPAGRRRCASWPSCTTPTSPPSDIAFLELDRPGDSALRRHLAEQRCLLRVGRGRRGALPAHRAHLHLARGPLARHGRDARDQLGRRPHRQHDVPRLRTGGGARLGDGRGRAPRDRHRLDGLSPPLPRRHRRPGRAAGHAAFHAPRRRGSPPTSATRATRPRTSTSTRCTRRCATPS